MELINVRCSQGRLIITDTHILTERYGKTQMMERRSFTSLKTKGALWSHKVIFYGQGKGRLVASGMSGRNAKRVRDIMTGRD